MATPLAYRLVIRDAADENDELIISSVATDEHPYLTDVPTVDGAAADLLQATVDVGAGTIKFWDEFVAGVARIGHDGFEEYGTELALEARWTTVGPLGTTIVATSSDSPRLSDGVQYLDTSLPAVDPGPGSSYLTRTFTGLPADTPVQVRVWMRPGLIGGSFESEPGGVEAQCGLRVIGADGVTDELYDHADFVILPVRGPWPAGTDGDLYAKQQLRVANRTNPDGTLVVQLGCFDYVSAGGAPFREFMWDLVEIWPDGDGDGHIYTKTLHDLQADVARLTQLSRRARFDITTDGGENWTPFHHGYLNRQELDGGEWTITVGDTTRQEQQTELFATLPDLDPASLDDPLPMPAPRVGLILGGPIAADPMYGKFAGIEDYGPTRWRVEQILTELGAQPGGDRRVVRLKFVSGTLRPWFAKVRTKFDQDEWEAVNHLVQPYFRWDWERYRTPNTATVNHFGYFPDLTTRLTATGGGALADGTVVERMPIARPVKHELFKWDKPKAEYDALVGNDSVMYVDWGDDDGSNPFPGVNDEFDVTLFSRVISKDNPLLIAGHPVDIKAYGAALSGIPIDAATRVSAKAAIGPGHWFEGAVEKQKFADLAKTLGGGYGVMLRVDLATGARQFVPTRVRPTPTFAITSADRLDATDDGSGDGQPPIWASAEDSVVNRVVFETQRFRRFEFRKDGDRVPLSMLVTHEHNVEGYRGDTTVNGDRTLTYSLPGQMMLRATDGTLSPLVLATDDPANPGFAQEAGGIIVDFAGWGVIESVVLVDAESDAAAAQLGDEGTLDLPDLPVPVVGGAPLTQRGAGPRVVRLVKRDPVADGAVQLTLVHAGELSQTAVAAPSSTGTTDSGTPEAPTLSLAPSADAPTTVVTVTLTNGEALGADNLTTELQQLVQAATPAADDEGTDFGPVTTYDDGDATTIDAPAAAPGSTVWVRARSVNARTGVASAWTAWVSETLAPVTNGGSTAAERPYAPPQPSISYTMDAGGAVTATVTAPGAASVKLAASTSGVPTDATVRAASADSAAPFVFADVITLAAGDTATLAAFAYDATGNESAKAVTTAARSVAGSFDLTGAVHGDLLYVDALGPTPALVRLSVPDDWSSVDYVLGIANGVPAWREAVGTIVVAAGLFPAEDLFPSTDLYPEAP